MFDGEKRCSSCVHVMIVPGSLSERHGGELWLECHRYPTTVEPSTRARGFPIVSERDWCSEHAEVETS